jgi:Lrp/AsnC family leucine-responsive transcriptional regulator
METLDDIDTRLIDLLREDASLPVKSLAASLGISIATVQRRREALVDRGVIRRYTIEVDPSLAGRPALMLVDVSLETATEAVAASFKRRVEACPDVLECFQLAGHSAFLLVVALAEAAELDRFSHWLRAAGAVIDTSRPATRTPGAGWTSSPSPR